MYHISCDDIEDMVHFLYTFHHLSIGISGSSPSKSNKWKERLYWRRRDAFEGVLWDSLYDLLSIERNFIQNH